MLICIKLSGIYMFFMFIVLWYMWVKLFVSFLVDEKKVLEFDLIFFFNYFIFVWVNVLKCVVS